MPSTHPEQHIFPQTQHKAASKAWHRQEDAGRRVHPWLHEQLGAAWQELAEDRPGTSRMIQTRARPHAQHLAGDSREDGWQGKHEVLLAAAESRQEGRKANAGATERSRVKDPGQGTKIINGFLHAQDACKCFISHCHSSESSVPHRARQFVQGKRPAEAALSQHLPASPSREWDWIRQVWRKTSTRGSSCLQEVSQSTP